MFARLRRSVALWICPELRLIEGPINVGFFDAEAARAHTKPRREWHEAEIARGLESAKILGMDAAHRIKSIYPAVKNVGDVGPVASAEVARHLPDALEQEHLRCGVMAEGQGCRQQPDLGQERQAEFDEINPVGDIVSGHGSLPVDGGAAQGKAKVGSDEAESKAHGKVKKRRAGKRPYRHLTPEERRDIVAMLAKGMSMKEVAEAVGRHQGTISHIRSTVQAVVAT